MSFLLFMSDFGTSVLIGAGVGAVVGGTVGLMFWFIKSNKIKKHFNINKGMTYEQVIAALGEPNTKKEKGEKVICRWFLTINGRNIKASAIFKNNLLKTIG